MNKIVAAAAVTACAAVTTVATPFSAYAAPPNIGEVLSGCDNGTTGYVLGPDNSTTPFGTVPGTQFQLANHGAGVYQFFTNQPAADPAYGPGLDGDRSASFANEGTDGAIVNFDSGASMRFGNNRANGFQFAVPSNSSAFHVFYKCDGGAA